MQKISKSVVVDLPHNEAFNVFVSELTSWWPKKHTWSKDKLIEINISPVPGGHCTEVGPRNFRCDWGTVTDVKLGDYIILKWQIAPSRAPEPDPDKASRVAIHFQAIDTNRSRVALEHSKFENHGDGHEAYRTAMDAEQGWDYLLACFEQYTRTAKRLTVEVNS